MFLNILKVQMTLLEHIAGTPPFLEVASASENVKIMLHYFMVKFPLYLVYLFLIEQNIYQMTVTLAVILFNIKWYYFNVKIM